MSKGCDKARMKSALVASPAATLAEAGAKAAEVKRLIVKGSWRYSEPSVTPTLVQAEALNPCRHMRCAFDCSIVNLFSTHNSLEQYHPDNLAEAREFPKSAGALIIY